MNMRKRHLSLFLLQDGWLGGMEGGSSMTLTPELAWLMRGWLEVCG